MTDGTIAVNRGYRLWTGVAFLIGAAAWGCAPTPTAPTFRLTEEEWTYGRRTGSHISTDHFDIYTTIDDRELREFLPVFLESAYRQYKSLVPLADQTGPKLQTYIFANRHEWDRHVREHFPARYDVYSRISAGGFAERNQCIVYYIRRIFTLSVTAHEGFHQYLGAHFTERVPAWLNEGMACYCETFQVRDGVPDFTPTENAMRLNSLRVSLSGDNLLPLKEILATDAGQVIVQSRSTHTMAYYAQAWALVCMIRDGMDGKYRAGLEALCADLGDRELRVKASAARIAAPNPSGTSYGEAVFRAYISNDLDAFEAEYQRYLRGLAAF